MNEWKGTRNLTLGIMGVTRLVMHRWSDKARKQMADKQAGKAVKTKTVRNPEEEYEQSVYRLEDGRLGFPAVAFKKCLVRGAKAVGLVMADVRSGFFVEGVSCKRDQTELVPIEGEVQMRTDMVRLTGNSADLRYRGEVIDWSAELHINYNPLVITEDQIRSMAAAAGYGTGIGENRPEKGGEGWGRFELIE